MKRSNSPVDAARRALLLGAAAALALPAGAAPRELLVVGAHFARVYERANGEFSGMAVEIIRAIAGELGQPVYFELYPWARAQSMVAQGQADILVGPYKSPERLELFTFSERPFYQDQMVFFSRSNAPFAWDGSYASLRGKRIVIINGWAYGDEFDAARKDLLVSVTNSVESALTMLSHGRVDLFASNVRNTEPVVPLLALEGKVVPVGRTICLQRGFFAFPRRPEYDVMRARFDHAFNAYVDSGELRKLGKRLNVQVP
ncbi:transporter substrate-binding domain-containing protein [Massilia antarctica]|uniref:Transporter substrate-binding domain-containing protein n=1 Tax=Massilia antarctica TaxID=2765360 RepID=A0AA48W9B6_9BURK|nr:transporter substrate-binding domain-containing protein [Massilia antarctica]QPI47518.1 transporter substrate-binding domain-containing protein [Massilia antarctica]